MKHGISLLPDCRPATRGAREYYEDVLRISRLADEAGLDYVKMTEHYLKEYGGYCPSPLTFLAAVAAQTSRIRLMTGCVLPAFHHPIQLAAHTAMVDALSGGRLDVGFARAWMPYEFAAFGVSMDESRDRFNDTIAAVLRLWTEEKVSEDSPFFSFRDATSLPAPVQRPHPPVWGAAVRSRQSFAWLAEQGFGLLVTPPPRQQDLAGVRDLVEVYLDTFEDVHGDAPDAPRPRVAVSIPLYVAETDDEAYATADPLLREYLTVWAEAAEAWMHTSSKDYPTYSQMALTLRNLDIADFRSLGTAVVGSPATVLERARRLQEFLSVDTFLWQVDFGGQDGPTMERSFRLFADEVLPHLR
ncbi:LLM class flavin-dependent oxidoreductase [Actinomycetota bacterium Odt1-20B]